MDAETMLKPSQEAANAALEAVSAANTMPAEQRRDYLEMLGCAAIHFMRMYGGDDYVRGWLEHALSDLDRPPLVTLRKPS